MKQARQPSSQVLQMIIHPTKGRGTAEIARPSEADRGDEWHVDHAEGQLAIDVIDQAEEILVISTMAGAVTSQLEVYIHNDLLTIRGMRISPVEVARDAYVYHECFWGKFSRTIVLPVDVKGDLARAEFVNGVLLIRIPKQRTDTHVPITIVDE